jgi:hypothetical protein
MTVMESRLAAILQRAGTPGRRFLTVPHSPLLEGLQGLERAGLIRLDLTTGRKDIWRASAFWVGGDHHPAVIL